MKAPWDRDGFSLSVGLAMVLSLLLPSDSNRYFRTLFLVNI
jgi:hypothetical protein